MDMDTDREAVRVHESGGSPTHYRCSLHGIQPNAVAASETLLQTGPRYPVHRGSKCTPCEVKAQAESNAEKNDTTSEVGVCRAGRDVDPDR